MTTTQSELPARGLRRHWTRFSYIRITPDEPTERIKKLLELNQKHDLINKRRRQRETATKEFKTALLNKVCKDLENAMKASAKDPNGTEITWFPSPYSREIVYGGRLMPEDSSLDFTEAEKAEITKLAHDSFQESLLGMDLEEHVQDGKRGFRIKKNANAQ